MTILIGAPLAYLLAPEVSALLFYMPDPRHCMQFSTFWNTGVRIGEYWTLSPESLDLDGLRPFVKVLSEKVRAHRGRGSFFYPGYAAHVSPQLYQAHALLPPAEKVIQALAGHKNPRSMEVYTPVFALDMVATLKCLLREMAGGG